MGPRFCERGNELFAVAQRAPIRLQWGHAFVSVETEDLRCSSARRAVGFNGATLL